MYGCTEVLKKRKKHHSWMEAGGRVNHLSYYEADVAKQLLVMFGCAGGDMVE